MIVPFGKYKNKNIDNLINDEQYVKWLLNQSFLREKYSSIYKYIIEKYTDLKETPIHNEMQILWLKKENLEKFGNYFLENVNNIFFIDEDGDNYNWCLTVLIKDNKDIIEKYDIDNRKFSYTDCYTSIVSFEDNRYFDVVLDTQYEILFNNENIDKMHTIFANNHYIELKPLIGEDYPDILRKMKSRINKKQKEHVANRIYGYGYKKRTYPVYEYTFFDGCYWVITKEFISTSTTLNEVKKYFNMANINFITLSELGIDENV